MSQLRERSPAVWSATAGSTHRHTVNDLASGFQANQLFKNPI